MSEDASKTIQRWTAKRRVMPVRSTIKGDIFKREKYKDVSS